MQLECCAADVSTGTYLCQHWCATNWFVEKQAENSNNIDSFKIKMTIKDSGIVLLRSETYLGMSSATRCCWKACNTNSLTCSLVELFENTTSFIRPDLSNTSLVLFEGTLRGSTHRNRMNFRFKFLDLEVDLDAIALPREITFSSRAENLMRIHCVITEALFAFP